MAAIVDFPITTLVPAPNDLRLSPRRLSVKHSRVQEVTCHRHLKERLPGSAISIGHPVIANANLDAASAIPNLPLRKARKYGSKEPFKHPSMRLHHFSPKMGWPG